MRTTVPQAVFRVHVRTSECPCTLAGIARRPANKTPPADAEPARTTRTIASLAPQVHTAHVTYDTLLGSGGNEPVIALLSSFSDLQQRSEVDTDLKITGTSNTIIVVSLTGSRALHVQSELTPATTTRHRHPSHPSVLTSTSSSR